MVVSRSEDLLSVVRLGLRPQLAHPRKVIVVGAGMAGLVVAYELHRAGHDVVILEATQRLGGRILTVREPFSNGLYAEAGAMRVPSTHKLTQAYIEKFGLPSLEFTKAGQNSFFYFRGRRHLMCEVERDPASLGLDLVGPTGDRTIVQLWADVIRDMAERVEADERYWDELADRYGDYSLYDFLRSEQWSTEAIASFALIEGLEPVIGKSFLDLLQIEVTWHGAAMTQIDGGMDRLPAAFWPELQHCIRFGTEMVALDYTSDSVTVHYKTNTGLAQATGNFAVLTVPYPAMRFVDVLKPFSQGKQMAIRQLHYCNAVKIMLECRRRFWEDDEALFGGVTVTDLPIRLVFYPDHGRATGRGVLMGCYTYEEEANRWNSLPADERIGQALKYVAQIHPQVTTEFDVGVCKVWGEDKYAGGAFALFEPGQQSRLYSHMVAPEGPVHFAGEHASLKHCWIEGAVESGLRAAWEVHQRSFVPTSP